MSYPIGRLSAHQWKMQFNPDKNKQGIQVIFSQRKDRVNHPPMFFNRSELAVKTEHKYLGMIFDSKLSFRSCMVLMTLLYSLILLLIN